MYWNSNIWNIQYIHQNAIQQNHFNQVLEIQKSVKALKDFLDSSDRIQPQYQEMATKEYCMVLIDYINKSDRNNI